MSVTLTINGQPAALTPLGEGRWRAERPTVPASVAASVKDRAGNVSRLTRTAAAATPPPPNPKPPRPSMPRLH
jgi:hypothetical protein